MNTLDKVIIVKSLNSELLNQQGVIIDSYIISDEDDMSYSVRLDSGRIVHNLGEWQLDKSA